jgi:hypothetical protein
MLQLCDECSEVVESYGFACKALLDCVIECQICEKPVFLLHETYSHTLKLFVECLHFLEVKGYLVSTEIADNVLLVKLNTRRAKYRGDVICWCCVRK